jgi:DNA-binding response OmpR family regulator
MQPSADAVDVPFHALLVTQSQELEAAVQQALQDTRIVVTRLFKTSCVAADVKREPVPVVLVTTDVGWRELLREVCNGDADQPSVIVLTPKLHAELWTEALTLGAFDAITPATDRHRFLWTLGAAYRRWERRQLAHQALDTNPLQAQS